MKRNFFGDFPSFLRIVHENVALSRPRVPHTLRGHYLVGSVYRAKRNLKVLKDHYLDQGRQDHAEAEGPDKGDHEKNIHSAVDLVVAPVVRDQHIPEEVIFCSGLWVKVVTILSHIKWR